MTYNGWLYVKYLTTELLVETLWGISHIPCYKYVILIFNNMKKYMIELLVVGICLILLSILWKIMGGEYTTIITLSAILGRLIVKDVIKN